MATGSAFRPHGSRRLSSSPVCSLIPVTVVRGVATSVVDLMGADPAASDTDGRSGNGGLGLQPCGSHRLSFLSSLASSLDGRKGRGRRIQPGWIQWWRRARTADGLRIPAAGRSRGGWRARVSGFDIFFHDFSFPRADDISTRTGKKGFSLFSRDFSFPHADDMRHLHGKIAIFTYIQTNGWLSRIEK